ncbi:MAG: DUF1217 domain-containing protein [Pseudomonadota bacterium]
MSFTPILPMSGPAGWAILKRTMATQTATLNATPEMARDVDYFRAKIGQITTADQLVGDRRLLKVALGAFGLEADIANKAFIKKILTDDLTSNKALANRLADKRYLQMASTFRFDRSVPATQGPNFATAVLTAYQARTFESAVGEQDEDLHLALNAQRELATLGDARSSETTKWLTILGNAPLSRVFQKALGLPSGTSGLNLDQQLGLYQAKAFAIFGDSGISQFADTTKTDMLLKRFLSRAQADQLMSQSASGSVALTLMQQSRSSL